MPSFDIVSELDKHEVKNAIDQADKEISTRFDFKGTESSVELTDDKVIMLSESTFQLQQMFSVICTKLSRRGIDIACMEVGDAKGSGKLMRQEITLKQGVESVLAKKIVKLIKDKKLKVQAAINGDKVRVTGKNRDDLQEVIQMLRNEKLEQPLQFDNFRD
ncbi:YajQ family cyclic di-GMP-binding protein [Crenothrix sp.]|uniref:YajQ family cyclic di-GMP-binding protein n=1 Tax=Crenothrix sp. TaxID=3100433 RepID=UPI00374D4233